MSRINLTLAAVIAIAASTTANSATNPSNDLKNKIATIGTIKAVHETTTRGMYAWLLEKNGKTLVLYNTPDNKNFIKGDIYDLDSKKIISNKYALESLKFASVDFRNKVLETQQTKTKNTLPTQGYMNLSWRGNTIPDALKLVDSLAGAKEGKGLPQDTLYIFYDPTCTWCHTTYDNLRPIVQAGYTIKWLPTFARGKSESSISLNSYALQNPSQLSKVFNRAPEALNTTPLPTNTKASEKNLQFLFAYHNKVLPDTQPSVPFGLFLDKTTGKVTHIQGLSEKPIIEMLYGEN